MKLYLAEIRTDENSIDRVLVYTDLKKACEQALFRQKHGKDIWLYAAGETFKEGEFMPETLIAHFKPFKEED